MKTLNKLLILSFFIFSIPSIGLALPKCGNTLHNCTGTYTWENGDEYDGDWKNNKKHGFGTFYWNDGDKYVGEYLNNKRHGKGRYTNKSGDKYDGDWVNDKRTGKGKFVKTNGYSYEGDFVDNKFKGVGTIILPDKRVIVGFFKDNKLLYARHEWESVKRSFCRKFSYIIRKKLNIKYWESSEQRYKEFINKIPKDDLTKLGLINDYNDLINCFKKSQKIITSKYNETETNAMKKKLLKRLKAKGKELADKVEKENQHTIVNLQGKIIPLKIPNLKEYNSTKSVGLSKAHPAIKFIIENNSSIDFWQVYVGTIFDNRKVSIEEASTCTLKVRDNLSGKTKEQNGKVRKVYIDFNKANWKTLDVSYGDYYNKITLDCSENCFFKYGMDFRHVDTVTWRPKKYISLLVDNTQTMHIRLNNALRDLRKVCNKSTTKY